jgi:AcrR family transcriptional regulator
VIIGRQREVRAVREEVTQNRRADAERNRRHLLLVAHTTFSRLGTEVPVREIARRAGLAAATVHRHFPSRDDLVAAVLAEQASRCSAQLGAALDDPDVRRALTRTFHRFGEWQGPLTDAMLARPSYGSLRREHGEVFARLVDRAREEGVLRPRVTLDDVRLGLMALTSVRASPGDAVQRLTGVVLSGLLTH